MTFRRNVLISYLSQIYVAVVGVVVIPVYVQLMGLEAYGLIAFYLMLQTWFLLMDIGFSPTLSQQVARYRGGALPEGQLWQLLQALELIFFAVAAASLVVFASGSEFIASHWLQARDLDSKEIRTALVLMAVLLAMRWMTCLYRAAVNGFECLAWLGGWAALMSTLRFLAVIPVLMIFGADVTVFFSYQLVVAALELWLVNRKVYRLMPPREPGFGRRVGTFKPIRDVLGFSLSIGFSGSVYIAVTQVDKLVLSRTLSLSDYGAFSVAALLAAGIFMLSSPIGNAIMPRMTRFQAEGKIQELTNLYRAATQLVIALVLPVASVLAIFPEEVLWAWTGNKALSALSAPVLSLYSIGYAIFMIGAFPYYLQFSFGNLRLHVFANVIFAVVFVPSLIYAAMQFGMVGAGWTWLLLNAAYLLFWVPVVHRRFLPKKHLSWMGQDVLLMTSVVAVMALLVRWTASWPLERLGTAVQLFVIGMILMVVAMLSSVRIRVVAISALQSRWRSIAGRT